VVGGGAAIGATWLLARRETSESVKARAERASVPTYGFEVVKTYAHDADAYTQGLLFHKGEFYESTGREGKSTVRRVELATGKVLQSSRLAGNLFGEGLALVGDELFQLTWQNEIALVYDRDTLREKRRAGYKGEGWGLTYDGKHLILSNGSDVLQFLDPGTFKVQRRISVKLDGSALKDLNELEYVVGEIWANVWYVDGIARIDPKSGKVIGWIDLAKLWPAKDRPDRENVLNGIAYDEKDKRIFVTGKNWPKLYEIKVVKS
jgi:glutamine cyclotransferase